MLDTILIVDDEPHFRNSLKRILESEGFTVDTAANGKDTFTAIRRQRYAVVLLDLCLPDLHGIEIAEFLTRHDRQCAVIILTGQATITSAMQAVQFGCYDYLTKPCRAERVLQTLKQALENRSLKNELCACNTKYRRLAEATWEGIVTFSQDRIAETNQQFCDLFKVREQDAVGRPLYDFIPEMSLPLRLGAHHVERTPVTMATEGIRSTGEVFPAEVRFKKIVDNGTSLWVAAIRDLSERRKEELDRTKLEEKLQYAMRMESIGLMAGSVAHDLNNILSSVVTFPELLLLDMPANTKYRADLKRIKEAGKQAAAVVADLLTVARGSTSQKERVNLNEVLTDYQNSLDFQLQEQFNPGINISVELGADLPLTQASVLHINKSIINLVQNAVEATSAGGEIVIFSRYKTLQEPLKGYEAISPGQYAVIGVKDSGQGIDNEHLPHIFEPFYSKKQMGKSGTGLGLTVIMHTMRDHCGFIDVQSSAQGTTFELYFPVSSGHEKIASTPLSLDRLLGKGEKILVVDDEENQRIITASILKRLGYTPFTAETGEKAIELIRHERIDLLVLDMIMEPGLSGYETFREILQISPAQKAVVTSGYHNHPDREKIRGLGVSHYLAKPLSVAHLALAIQQEINT